MNAPNEGLFRDNETAWPGCVISLGSVYEMNFSILKWRCPRHFLEGGFQHLLIHGLGYIIIHACGQATIAIALHCMRCH